MDDSIHRRYGGTGTELALCRGSGDATLAANGEQVLRALDLSRFTVVLAGWRAHRLHRSTTVPTNGFSPDVADRSAGGEVNCAQRAGPNERYI
ncbi:MULTISPECIES: hypothetical protein [Burkholderia cepacia complex]|uniref:hypothetical protein n=1 Tax=Burkholderia cepacia complex TaxID=87882 RepID=UPI001B918B0D|nr:hypothetical protein [Burkholderia cenocepacia]MBR8321134.1 hypothetical protein [Burkholderia cenocepacia]